MPQINDININVSSDRIQACIIFLIGFASGGFIGTLTLKSRLKKRSEIKSLEHIERLYDTSARSVDRAANAMDNLIKQTKKLEEAVNTTTSHSGFLHS